MTSLTVILAATQGGLGIGRSGALPWHLPADLAYFSRVTKRRAQNPAATAPNSLIMGRKTWDSIPEKYRPLALRRNVVVSRGRARPDGSGDRDWVSSFDEAVSVAGDIGGRVFVIGGAEIYSLAMADERTRSVLLTSVEGAAEDFGCDVFFPVDVRDERTGWVRRGHEELCGFVGEEVPEGMREQNGVRYQFELYQRP